MFLVVEVCVDYDGVNVFHVCLDFFVVYGVGVCVNVRVVVYCFLTSGCCLLCCDVMRVVKGVPLWVVCEFRRVDVV